MSRYNTAPYPQDGIQWDPVDSLEELKKMREDFIVRQGSHVQGPPLPSRPPQHIVDQHIPPVGGTGPLHTTPTRTPLRTARSEGRLRGPRDFPPHLMNSSPIYNSTLSPDIPPYPVHSPGAQVEPNAEYSSSPVQYDNRCNVNSSPFATPTSGLTGPRPMPGSSPSYSMNSSPIYQRNLSPNRSPTRHPLSVNANLQQVNEPNYMDSPISSLPDIPVLTPGSISAKDSPYFERQFTPLADSPTLSRPPLSGPRLRPSMGSIGGRNTSPSTSPGKTGYYDHRTSWRSEYSINVIDFEEEPEHDDVGFYEPPHILDNDTLQQQKIQVRAQAAEQERLLQSMGSISLPDIKDIPPVPEKSSSEKLLPRIPDELSLPPLPFSARSLSVMQFSHCENISLLSDVFKWSIKLSQEWSDDLLVTKNEYKKSLKLLFKHSSSKMNSYVIDNNIEAVMASFERQNAIYVNAQDIIHFFDNVKVSGVFPQLTGCYSRIHEDPGAMYQCYSPRCSLTIYQPPIPITPAKDSSIAKLGEWISHWNITPQDLEDMDEDEVKKQSHIFELIRQQQNIIRLGELQVKEYGQSFKSTQPQLLPDISKFYNDAFNSVKPLIELHRKHLFEPLITKLNAQGKYISGIGEIFLNWASQATVPYLKYTESLAAVRELIKYEKSRHSRFADWLYHIDQRPSVAEASLDHNRIFFSGFIGHTQLLSLALASVQKKTKVSDIDHGLLGKAVEEVDKLNRKIDGMQESALQSRHLKVLSRQLLWKSNVLEADLKLRESIRRLIKKSEVTRKDKWTSSVNYLILLDNYLLITEEQKDGHYKISEKPIPVEFLQLETKNFSTAELSVSDTETFPFKIRYTGQNLSYTFLTETLSERDAWFSAYTQVKSKKSKSQDFEPFNITVLSDQFAYEEGQQPQKLPVCVPGSNIDRTLTLYQESMEEEFADMAISRPIMMSGVLSSTTFTHERKTYHALGLNFGLFITEDGASRGWKRVLDMARITQVEQLDHLMVVLSDKALFYFNIVSLLLNYYDLNTDGKIVGERLSKRDVVFFKIGSYYNTKLLFLIKTPIQSLGGPRFKVFTPIFDSFGTFEYFQLYKRFQHTADCYDISIFNSMFVLHTIKGFEILSFQIMYESQPIPKFLTNLKKPKSELEMIKKSLKSGSCKPLFMAKAPQKPQFYLVYDSFAIAIDTIGQLINDNFIFPFKFKCTKATLQGQFLVCIGEDIVEIFDLSYDDVLGFQKFDPVQIITGKDITLIDPINAKFSMAHPKMEGRQLVLSLDKI